MVGLFSRRNAHGFRPGDGINHADIGLQRIQDKYRRRSGRCRVGDRQCEPGPHSAAARKRKNFHKKTPSKQRWSLALHRPCLRAKDATTGEPAIFCVRNFLKMRRGTRSAPKHRPNACSGDFLSEHVHVLKALDTAAADLQRTTISTALVRDQRAFPACLCANDAMPPRDCPLQPACA